MRRYRVECNPVMFPNPVPDREFDIRGVWSPRTPSSRFPMSLRTRLAMYAHPRTWLDKGLELTWRTFPGSTGPMQITWPVDREALKDVVVRWPWVEWKARRMMGVQVRFWLDHYVRTVDADIPQPYDRVINFEVDIRGSRHAVMVETSDYPDLNETAYADAELYFKMEFAKAGYGDRDRLLPGGYTPNDLAIYRYLPRLRALRDHAAPLYEVSGRYGLSMEKRRKPMEILRGSTRFSYYGGEGKVRYSRYLREAARSKVCIDLPSMSSVTFRMIDYLAIGSCIVGPPHTNKMIEPFVDGEHVAYCKPDYSDLEAVCVHYLENEDERRKLIRNSRAFFDTYLHPRQLGAYYVYNMLAKLG